MKYKATTVITVSLILAMYLDIAVFYQHNLADIKPNIMMALIVSLGFAIGSLRAGIIGCGIGFLYDIICYNALGVTALSFMLCGVISGMFFRKFYADNIILPSVVAAMLAFVSENVFAIVKAFSGVNYNYFQVLGLYILPCSLLTGVFCILIHLLIRPMLRGYGKFIAEKNGIL